MRVLPSSSRNWSSKVKKWVHRTSHDSFSVVPLQWMFTDHRLGGLQKPCNYAVILSTSYQLSQITRNAPFSSKLSGEQCGQDIHPRSNPQKYPEYQCATIGHRGCRWRRSAWILYCGHNDWKNEDCGIPRRTWPRPWTLDDSNQKHIETRWRMQCDRIGEAWRRKVMDRSGSWMCTLGWSMLNNAFDRLPAQSHYNFLCSSLEARQLYQLTFCSNVLHQQCKAEHIAISQERGLTCSGQINCYGRTIASPPLSQDRSIRWSRWRDRNCESAISVASEPDVFNSPSPSRVGKWFVEAGWRSGPYPSHRIQYWYLRFPPILQLQALSYLDTFITIACSSMLVKPSFSMRHTHYLQADSMQWLTTLLCQNHDLEPWLFKGRMTTHEEASKLLHFPLR